MWYLYIVECRDGSYYVGITTDLRRRLAMHNAGVASRCTRSRRPVRYRYAEPHATRSDALKREAEIKKWAHRKKQALFTSDRNLFRRRRPRRRAGRRTSSPSHGATVPESARLGRGNVVCGACIRIRSRR